MEQVWLFLIIGLILGWVIEWIIDWRFWRREVMNLREENQRLRRERSPGSDRRQPDKPRRRRNKVSLPQALQARRCGRRSRWSPSRFLPTI
jgi:hypothetical protein